LGAGGVGVGAAEAVVAAVVKGLRVAHVNEAAVAGDTALIRGYAAFFLAEALGRLPGGIEALLARSGVPADRRLDVLRAYEALREVGGAWRVALAAAASGSSSGTRGGQGGGEGVPSGRGSFPSRRLSARETAAVLGVSDRYVRELGASSGLLGGERDSSGRWSFDAAAVEAELTRRREAACGF
jgi:hypothetical protein